MRNRAKVIASKLIYSGPVFGVRHDTVAEPGGVRATRDVVTHHGSVVVMPILAGGRILLVRQYRYAVGQYLWELPAGRIEPGESFLSAAKRELLEETGYRARRFRQLWDLFPTPGFVSERMVLFTAQGLRAGLAQPEADEKISARGFSLAEIERSIGAGLIRDAKTVAGVLFYARFVARRAGTTRKSILLGKH